VDENLMDIESGICTREQVHLVNHFWMPCWPFPWLAWSWKYLSIDRALKELSFVFLIIEKAPLVPEILAFQNFARFSGKPI
jgi:hypothetical protein